MKISDVDIAKKMVNLRESANARDLEFNLKFSTIKRLLTVKNCYYTKIPFNEAINDPNSRTIDRLDNKKGYVEGNVVSCTKEINSLKSNLSLDLIKAIYIGVKKLL